MTNPLRQQMVARAVQQAQNGNLEITLRNVSMFLPGPTAFDAELKEQVDFELDADDIAPYLPAPTPEPVSLADRLADVEIEYVAPTPVESPAVRYQKLEHRSLELERERAELRVVYDVAIRDELNARHELDRVARAFMTGFGKPQTPDELLKQHAASEAERRRKIAAGELPAPRRQSTVGPSVLDRFAYATGGANGRRVGPNGEQVYGFRRGGQRPNAELARQAKLPSQR